MELVAVGPWGGAQGKKWEAKTSAHIATIIVAHGGVIDSLTISTIDSDGKKQCLLKIGGKGGDHRKKIEFDADEYLTSVEGYHGEYLGKVVVRSLTFITTHSKYGPYGQREGMSFSLPILSGAIVGFHGLASKYIDAIGVYLKPQNCELSSSNKNALSMASPWIKEEAISYSPRLWGGIGGRPWDDGHVYTGIRAITLYYFENESIIYSIQVDYDSNGTLIKAPVRGRSTWQDKHEIKFDYPEEFLLSVEGFYAPNKHSKGYEIISSLLLKTNRREIGPLGRAEIGTFFTFPIQPGKVGFCGRSGTYLDALGIHVKQ